MKRLTLNIAGLFVAIVAVLFNLPSLYLMAAILWLIPAASYLMGWLMLGGLTCARALPVSALPSVDYPTIQIQTFYPGASPKVMTSAVTAPACSLATPATC